nr:MAG TPA: Cytosine specific methyltransferase [Caudoviricetes sp.]
MKCYRKAGLLCARIWYLTIIIYMDMWSMYSRKTQTSKEVKMIKVNELFAGIGAFKCALDNLDIPHEIVGISEIDKYAIASYNAMWGDTRNYGDISKIEKLDYADLWTYGFPCQDISTAGKGAGIVKGETRSGLLYEVERLLLESQKVDELPKYLIMENVKNLVGKKFRADFERWLDVLETLGYKNYWQVLNAKDYGIPQNRERVFCVSILGEDDYQFPEKQPLALKLIDMLESQVDEKYYLSKEQVDKIKTSTFRTSQSRIQEKDWCDTLCARDYKDPKCVQVRPLGTIYAHASDRFGKGYIEGMSKTIKAISHDTSVVFSDYKIRKLTPKECWRLMGFDDVLFDRARSMCSNTQLYKQAGNSIVVDVVEQILDNLIPKEMR